MRLTDVTFKVERWVEVWSARQYVFVCSLP